MKLYEKSEFARNLNNRPVVVALVLNGSLSVKEAASRLQLSTSHTYALVRRAEKYGLESLRKMKKRGKPPKKFGDNFKSKILNLYKYYCSLCKERNIRNCSFAEFTKLLKSKYGIKVSYSAVHSILYMRGVKSPYRHRAKKERKAHEYKERCSYEGELWLADGSPFKWFGGSDEYCLHIIQDDATGKPVALHLEKNECFFGYAEAMKKGISRYGLPQFFKTDKARVFFVPNKEGENLTISEQLNGVTAKSTQFGSILKDCLGVQMIPCHTPEAKGRVERIGGTLQRRLPFLFMLNGINDIYSANKFLESYIDEFSQELAVEPVEKENKYVPMSNNIDLTALFSIKQNRKTDSEGVFSFNNYKFKVKADVVNIRLRDVQVHLNKEWGIKVKIGSRFYDVEILQMDKNKKALGRSRLSIPIVWDDLFKKYLQLDAKAESRYHIA